MSNQPTRSLTYVPGHRATFHNDQLTLSVRVFWYRTSGPLATEALDRQSDIM